MARNVFCGAGGPVAGYDAAAGADMEAAAARRICVITVAVLVLGAFYWAAAVMGPQYLAIMAAAGSLFACLMLYNKCGPRQRPPIRLQRRIEVSVLVLNIMSKDDIFHGRGAIFGDGE